MGLFEKDGPERAALYTCFLNVKGKTLFDGIVVKPRLAGQTREDTEFWLDVHAGDVDSLTALLKRYAMRKVV